MCMTVDVANKQEQDVHTGGAIRFVSANNKRHARSEMRR